MKCQKCNCTNTKVTDTRPSSDGESIRRRRKCVRCGHRFSTVEVYGKMELIVIKRNGSEENFDPEKIMQGLQRAVREDENHEQKIEMLMQEILQLVLEQRLKKISSRNIALIVMEKLKQADAIAYLRFASVHKNFHEAHEFEQEFKNLEK